MNSKMNKYLLSGMLAAALGLLAASCSKDEVTFKVGTKPDKETIETVAGTLRSSRSLRDRVSISLVEMGDAAADKIYFRMNQPAQQAIHLTAAVDNSKVAEYNSANNTDIKPFPSANVDIANGGKLSIAAGERISGELALTFRTDGLAPGVYLSPIVLTEDGEEAAKSQVLYYGISVRALDLMDIPLNEDWLTVFYVNTSEVNPILADYSALEEKPEDMSSVKYTSLGHIINLRISQVEYNEASKRAIFSLTSDMRYVLEHADEYIRPMQDKGRKVCICIQGGGAGIGFCNMTDAQITDFVEQVKRVVMTYGLDGVNLWDEGAGYGKENMPEMNTTSYPKLIKAMREAMPDKMLTLVDKDEPTSYFDDTAKTGGIEVGRYIDYAWSGYVSLDRPVEFIYPWGWEFGEASRQRNPIAGMGPEHFGNFMFPCYEDKSEIGMDESTELWMMNMMMWGVFRSNNIVVMGDLPVSSTAYEKGYIISLQFPFSTYQFALDDMGEIMIIRWYNSVERIEGIMRSEGYGTFSKDW